MLLGQVDRQTLENFTSVTAESTEERTVSVHDDETELGVGLEQFAQSLGVELVVTKVKGSVDWLEGLEVNVDLALLSFRGDNFTTVDDQTIWGDLVVQLQTLLGGCDSGQDGKTIDSGLDVRGSTLQDRALGIWGLSGVGAKASDVRILQPASLPLEKSDPWGLFGVSGYRNLCRVYKIQRNREGNVRIMSEIMEVPFPRADSKRLINFLTFQISMFFSTSFPCCWELILGDAKMQYHQRGGKSIGL